ncbi:MAG: hypothetical protein WC758_01680 [Candidatus Woesearchaeota archaeon]|jgi:hypothetical protein
MDYLSNVRFDKALRIKEGLFVHNYKELLTELRVIDDADFKNDLNSGLKVINWIKENYSDECLLMRLEIARTRREFVRLLDKRINKLEHEQELEQKNIEPVKRYMPWYVNAIFFVAFAIVMLAFLNYTFENDEDSMKKYFSETALLQEQVKGYSERIAFLEKQNLELKDNLSIKENEILPIEAAIPAPRDRILLKDIALNKSMMIIYLNKSYLSQFEDTGSMLPILSSDAIGIEIIPLKPSDIYPGDIISYELNDKFSANKLIIIHRVLEVGYDLEGWYAITKGDNNPLKDKDKVRFSQIHGVLVGILY